MKNNPAIRQGFNKIKQREIREELGELSKEKEEGERERLKIRCGHVVFFAGPLPSQNQQLRREKEEEGNSSLRKQRRQKKKEKLG